MTSIHCPDCSNEVTGSEHTCPRCNFPISKLRGLSAAILTKNAERVAGLIQLGADVNAADNNGRSPLITAALMDDAEIVQMLLAAGARPEFVSSAGETALSVAKSREVERIIRRAIVVSKHKRTQAAPSSEDLPQRPREEPSFDNSPQRPREEPTLRFDNSLMFIEASPLENRNADQSPPIDVQLNEELFESIQSHKVNEEPTLRFDNSLMFIEDSPSENRNADPSRSIDVQLNEELFESLQSHKVIEEPIPELALDFERSMNFADIAAWEKRSVETKAIPVSKSFEPQIDAEDTIGIADEEATIEIPEISQVDEAPPVDLQIQEEQPPLDFSYQQITPHQEPRYFFAAIIGASLLIMFMLLTWPGQLTAPAPHAIQNVKTAKQITKPPVEKQEPPPIQKSEITAPEEHLIVDEKPPLPIPKSEIMAPEKHLTADENPPLPPPQVKNTALVKKGNRSASITGDQEKLRLARALNSLGFSLIKQGRHGEAIPVLERSLRSFPKGTNDVYYAYALFNLGVAWRKAGRPDIAIPILEKRLQIENQRDIVARELSTARQQAIEAGFQQ